MRKELIFIKKMDLFKQNILHNYYKGCLDAKSIDAIKMEKITKKL